jgi:hypothetical protein
MKSTVNGQFERWPSKTITEIISYTKSLWIRGISQKFHFVAEKYDKTSFEFSPRSGAISVEYAIGSANHRTINTRLIFPIAPANSHFAEQRLEFDQPLWRRVGSRNEVTKNISRSETHSPINRLSNLAVRRAMSPRINRVVT